MTAPKLDYGGFPHLITRILQCAPHSVVLAFRGTCKALKDAALPLLCEFIILEPTTSKALAASSPYGNIPGLNVISLHKPSFDRLLPALLAFTRHTKVVEVQGFVPAEHDLRVAAQAFPNLETYRIVTEECFKSFTPYFPFKCKTVVLFYNDGEGPNPPTDEFLGYDFEDAEDDEPGPVIPRGANGRVPEGVERIVVNMKGSDIPVADFFDIFNFPTSVKHFDIIFPHYRLDKPQGTLHVFYPHILVMDTCELVGTDALYTLVGLDLGPKSFDMLAAMRRHLDIHSVFKKGDKTKDQHIDEIMSHVSLATKDQYAAQIAGDVNLHVVERYPVSSMIEDMMYDDDDEGMGEDQMEQMVLAQRQMTDQNAARMAQFRGIPGFDL